jgi:hypothetical protein
MPVAYDLYNKMTKDDIVLSYKGDITKDLLASVYEIIESSLGSDHAERQLKKKFYHILIECLQNVFHHKETLVNNGKEDVIMNHNSSIFMICKRGENEYKIITGNFILNADISNLKAKIEKINTMTAEELKAYYLNQLNTTELSEKGGAGLGLIDIARKSGHKLEYDLQKVSDKYSFFNLLVTIN